MQSIARSLVYVINREWIMQWHQMYYLHALKQVSDASVLIHL